MFIFIAAGLGGLSVSHLLPGPGRSIAASIWARVIGGVVGVILLAGLLFSLLQRDSLAVVAEPFLLLLRAAAIAFFYVFIIPAAFIIDRVAALLRPLLRGEAVDLNLSRASASSSWRRRDPIRERLERPGVDRPGRRHPRGGRHPGPSVQEEVEEALRLGGGNPGVGPGGRGRRSRSHGVGLGPDPPALQEKKRRRRAPVPDGEPGVVEALKLYYRMLSVAGSRGSARASSETPLEFQGTLGRIFPVGLAETGHRGVQQGSLWAPCRYLRPTRRYSWPARRPRSRTQGARRLDRI